MFDLFGERRRARLREAPFPAEHAAIVDRNVPMSRRLPEADRRELLGHVAVFCAEKHFEGAGGLELTDEIRITVAAQACLLLLRRAVDEPYPELETVVVYPRGWRSTVRRPLGPAHVEGAEARIGESWGHGLVVLAWDSARHGAADDDDGRNVVLHEFAHQLDTESGGADGAPELPERGMYTAWARVLGAEYAALGQALHAGRPTTIDAYGATNPAEFFAVLTELFFERPRRLRGRHPELYAQLSAFYRQDPAEWAP